MVDQQTSCTCHAIASSFPGINLYFYCFPSVSRVRDSLLSCFPASLWDISATEHKGDSQKEPTLGASLVGVAPQPPVTSCLGDDCDLNLWFVWDSWFGTGHRYTRLSTSYQTNDNKEPNQPVISAFWFPVPNNLDDYLCIWLAFKKFGSYGTVG